MVNHAVAFFMVHPNRSKQAFDQLVDDWKGILVSDNYGVYVNWVNNRQTCLAHYIRKAKALVERKDESSTGSGKTFENNCSNFATGPRHLLHRNNGQRFIPNSC